MITQRLVLLIGQSKTLDVQMNIAILSHATWNEICNGNTHNATSTNTAPDMHECCNDKYTRGNTPDGTYTQTGRWSGVQTDPNSSPQKNQWALEWKIGTSAIALSSRQFDHGPVAIVECRPSL